MTPTQQQLDRVALKFRKQLGYPVDLYVCEDPEHHDCALLLMGSGTHWIYTIESHLSPCTEDDLMAFLTYYVLQHQVRV